MTETPDNLKQSLGRDVIRINTGDNRAATSLLENNSRDLSISRSDDGITLITEKDGSSVLPSILNLLNGAGIDLLNVDVKKPTLDEVFVHYTGREIRDEPTDKVQPRPRPHRRR